MAINDNGKDLYVAGLLKSVHFNLEYRERMAFDFIKCFRRTDLFFVL